MKLLREKYQRLHTDISFNKINVLKFPKMKNLFYVFLLFSIVSCGSTEPSSSGKSEIAKPKAEPEKKSEPDVDWSTTRSQVEIRKETKVYGLEDVPELTNPAISSESPKTKLDNSLTREKKGYRIQIFSTNSKKLADEIVIEAKTVYRYKVYMSFSAPNYTIRIGNYSKIEEAKLDLDEVQGHYKNATVVPDFIK